MKVLFLHGLNSKPGGAKAQALKAAGFDVLNPALPNEPFNISVKIAQDVVNCDRPDVIVGSSRGGAVAMAIDPKGAELILVAPAWKKYCPVKKIESAIILHSETDDVVPFEDTQELFRSSVGITVIACNDNHRMRKEETLEKIVECVKSFIVE
ncbi:MAG: alpha/beta hydrolase [Euryarchaeota archaeon]|mgnify:CR=1 FL=1|nr:alpha/beta hydrolase [Euryarchaeota archaeon]|tara:strand:- start:5740 stop:6198 length:459 start_codon:yes stop_codon:yes gene_type:complete